MDTIGALTSMALQYGVPLESLVKKFAHQRFEPSGYTRNPDVRNASSIIDYVFRWMATQFVPGYRESQNPTGGQAELPIPGLVEELKKKVNRPVPELPLAEERVADMPFVAATATAQPQRPKSAAHVLTHMISGQSDAPSCPNCGHIAVRNGACYKCLNCGESLGCS